jgi:hypothetical protein
MPKGKSEMLKERSLTTLSRLSESGEIAHGIGVADLLRDHEAVHVIHELCYHRHRFYSDVGRFLLRTGKRPLCILLDFDVIYAYVMGGTAGNASEAEIEYFFNNSQLPYAIPAGAAKELSRLIIKSFPLGIVNIDRKRPDWLSILPAQLEAVIDEHANMTTSSRFIVDVVIERASRLLNIVTNSRYKGVVSEFNNELKCMIQEKLAAIDDERRSRHLTYRGERTENDERDAENIAIVANQYIGEQKESHLERYVLLTATSAIHRVTNALPPSPWLSVSPRILAISDILDVFRKPRIAIAIARAVSESWADLEKLLYSRCNQIYDPDPDDDDRLPSIAREIQGTATQLLEREHAIRIEKASSQLPSVHWLQSVQQHKNLTPSLDDSAISSTHSECLRVLDALRGALSDLVLNEKAYPYVLIPNKSVHKVLSIRSDDTAFGNDEFVTVDLLKSGSKSVGIWARWSICCGDDRLVSCLNHIEKAIPLPAFDVLDERLSPILLDDNTYSQISTKCGMTVSTSVCRIWFSLPWIRDNGGWGALRLADLHRQLVEYSKQRKPSNPAWEGADELIQELCIYFPKYRVFYEVVPKDDSIGRQMSFYSTFADTESSEIVSHLYDWTGMRFAFRSRLAKAIREIVETY